MAHTSQSPPPRSDANGRYQGDYGTSSRGDDGYRRRKREDDDYRRSEGRDSRDHRRREYDSRRDDRRIYDRREGYSGRSMREPSRDRRDRDRRDRDKDRDGDKPRENEKERNGDRAGPSRRSRSRSPRSRSNRPGSRSRSPENKARPNFNQSGLLAAATNTVTAADGSNTVLKYNEPPEARTPLLGWRLYVFKGQDQVELLHINRQSAYLIGRDKTVADIFIDHPSSSKQHAVVQHRQVQERDEFGSTKAVIKPFIIDLESTNGTHVNGEQIPTSRFYELRASDVIKFGLSTREYVLLHDDAA